MRFATKVAGIPCQCQVNYYREGYPAVFREFGESLPEEPSEFNFDLLDRRGRHAPWLERKLTQADFVRLESEYLRHLSEHSYDVLAEAV